MNTQTVTREVFAVIGNKDCTEGRGPTFIKAYCETLATARRLGRKGYVQGGDCPIETRTLYKPAGQSSWLGPVEIERPTEADNKVQAVLNQQSVALKKARDAGLTEDEIKLLKI